MSSEPVLSEFQGRPWERQRDGEGELEPLLWYNRFRTLYLTMGPERSLLGAYNRWRAEQGKGRRDSAAGAWYRCCNDWRWEERAEAWDEEQMRKAAAEQEQEVEQMFRRHVQIGVGMQQAALKALRQIAEEGWQSLSPDQTRLLLKDGVVLERQARGLPAWLVQIATMTEEELVNQWEQLVGGQPPSVASEEPENEGVLDLDELFQSRPENGNGAQDASEEPGPGTNHSSEEG